MYVCVSVCVCMFAYMCVYRKIYICVYIEREGERGIGPFENKKDSM